MPLYAHGCDDLTLDGCIRQSMLKTAEQSLLHCYAQYFDPERPADPSGDAQKLGTLTHTLVLEPDAFTSRHRVAPDAKRTTIDGCQTLIAWLNDQLIDLFIEPPPPPGQKLAQLQDHIRELEALTASHFTICTPTDFAAAIGMHRSLWSHPQIATILRHPQKVAEQTILYRDESGIGCRATLDLHIPPCAEWPDGLIADLKTTRNASREKFLWQLEDFRYHWQADYYRRAFHAFYGRMPPYVWIVVENARPYASNLIPCGDELINYARAEYYPLLQAVHTAMQTGNWPGYEIDMTPATPSRRMIVRHEGAV